METVVEVLAAVFVLALGAFLTRRFPDTREKFGKDLDDALYRGAFKATWILVAISAVVVLALWLLL